MGTFINATRVIGFPGRYIQGPGVLEQLGTLVVELGGRRPVIISDDAVQAALGELVPRAMAHAELQFRRLRFAGECTRSAVADLSAQASLAEVDMVVALGGGKTIDTAKGVARELRLALIVAPTVASNDSPTSRLIVLYDETHRLIGVDYLVRNPDLVLVDTLVIVQAPLRFFRAGIGDAISKRFEAAQCAAAGGHNFFGGLPPGIALVMANQCHAAIEQHGLAALRDVARHAVTPAVETVTEATVLLSGLAFESGGLSLSHALLRGLTTVPGLASALHGEMVAFGSLVQLVLERRSSDELDQHAALLKRLGLPTTLSELGQDALTPQELQRVAELTMQAPYAGNFQRILKVSEVASAIVAADALGRSPD